MDTPNLTGDQGRVEQLLREAHLLRLRQQWAESETLCRQVLELEPENIVAEEMLADLLVGKGSLDQALEIYRKAFARQPQKVSLEEKIAHLVLLQAQEETERIQAQLLLSSPGNAGHRKRNATLAVLFSLLSPGGGQLFLRQYVKGAILMGAGLLGISCGMPDFFKMLYSFAGGRVHRGETPANSYLAFLGLLGLLVWFYSLLDASSQAGRSPRKGVE